MLSDWGREKETNIYKILYILGTVLESFYKAELR